MNTPIMLSLLLFMMTAVIAVKISSTNYHILHDDHALNHIGFQFLSGNAPRYHIPTPHHIHGFPRSPTTPAIRNPFSPEYGHSYPQPGMAVCAVPPAACRKTIYRTLDGSCNHLDNVEWGMANTRYGRLLAPIYSDGVQAPPRSITGSPLPNARQISLVVFGEEDVPDPNFTLMFMQWGQIITHDMSMSAGGTQSKKHPTRCCTDDGQLIDTGVAPKTCFAIIVPKHDPAYSQANIDCINFVRTLTDRDINCQYGGGPAEQLTVVTSYMDLSLVYGNSIQQNSEIRAFTGGRMIVDNRNGADWLPSSDNATADCDITTPNEICYKAGDIRVNQNPGLTILQTILLREHNRIADNLAHLNPHYDDRTLFQEARKINIAQFQHINYYEYLPYLLGMENMLKNRLIYRVTPTDYVNDFDTTIDPAVLNEHATAAFRYFHSQIEGRLDLINELRQLLGSLRLSDWLNRPGIIEVNDNFDSLTRGHATQPEELTDINFDREIKHFLFRRNRPFGGDLRAIDIQRNRDHALATYNDAREFCGLRRAHSWHDFGDLISAQSINDLRSVYQSHEDVDLTVGASLESHVAGALAGPTFLCILTEQFFRTRVGDRFFYENGPAETGFTPEQMAEIRKASIARLLCDNGNQVSSMQPRAFLSIAGGNPVVPCSEIPQVDLTKWIDQRKAYLPPNTHYGK